MGSKLDFRKVKFLSIKVKETHTGRGRQEGKLKNIFEFEISPDSKLKSNIS